MFYYSVIIYWMTNLIYPLSFEDVYYEQFFLYANSIRAFCFALCLFLYFSLNTNRGKSTLILMAIYSLYSNVSSILFGEITSVYYVAELSLFMAWTIWIMFRDEYKTAKTIDKNNILLAFYKGSNGSPIMHFFELFGAPVKSLCIIDGELALYLKANKETFQLKDSNNIFKKADDYVIVDTGVKRNPEFSKELEKYGKLKAVKFGLRIRCIEAVKNLLRMIGTEWEPTSFLEYNPGWYFRKCSKI